MAAATRQNSGEDLALFRITLPDGRLVFQRRTDDAPTHPGLLGFFGGHIEQGETPDEAAYRELGEETSIELSHRLPCTGRFTVTWEHGGQKTVYLYDLSVEKLNFEIYEGLRAEAYTKETALGRKDVVQTVRLILQGKLKNEL